MPKRSAEKIRQMTEMAKKIYKHHFGKRPRSIEYKPAGLTNFVFEVKDSAGNFIIRVSDSESKINQYLKEQWVVAKVRKIGVPVAKILEVGNQVVAKPYMLQEKVNGHEATNHPERLKIVHELGKYSKIIHSIKTSNFGDVFDWSENKMSKNASWKDYLNKELDMAGRLAIFEKHSIFRKINYIKLTKLLKRIEKWKIRPSLNHGDIRLKNVITTDAGKIIAIIDWDNCSSNIAPFWDFSIALHDLSIDAKQQFLLGYGITTNEFSKMAYAIKALNLINYAPKITRLIERKEKNLLEFYRGRLNGYLDLYSL